MRATTVSGGKRKNAGWAKARFARAHPAMLPYFDSTGSGGTLSFGASACMVIRVIETRS